MKKFTLILVFSLLLIDELSIMYSEVSSRSGGEWGGVNPILLLALAFFAGLFIFIAKSKGDMPLWGKAFVLFDIYVIAISIYHGIYQHSYGFGYSTILVCVQPVLLFYVMYFARQDLKMDRLSNILFFTMFVTFTAGFVISILTKREYNAELFVEDNNSYYLMYLLPALAVVSNKDKKLKMYILISFLGIFISMKRGGILALSGGLLIYYFLNNVGKKMRKSVQIGGVIILLAFAGYFLNDIMGGLVVDRFEEISDTGGSGRDLIWAEGVLLINSSSDIEKLTGHGFDSARDVTEWGVSLHNDYLEIIYDFGWIGLVLFIFFVIFLVYFIIKNKRETIIPPLAMALIICLLSMVVAHVIIYTHYFNLIALCFGAACGEHVRQKRLLKVSH